MNMIVEITVLIFIYFVSIWNVSKSKVLCKNVEINHTRGFFSSIYYSKDEYW